MTLMFGVLVEMHRQLLQLRELSGFVDTVQSIGFNAEVEFATLFSVTPDVAPAGSKAAILILSTGCSTCMTIAEHLSNLDQRGIYTLIEAGTEADVTVQQLG